MNELAAVRALLERIDGEPRAAHAALHRFIESAKPAAVNAVVGAVLDALHRHDAAPHNPRFNHTSLAASSAARLSLSRLVALAARTHADLLAPLLPRITVMATRICGDAEGSVRDAFAEALYVAALHCVDAISPRELYTLLLAPAVQALERPSPSEQQGGAMALRQLLAALSPAQLRDAVAPLSAVMRRHLKQPHTHGRTSLLECIAMLLGAVASATQAVPLVQMALASCGASDWRERLAAVGVLRAAHSMTELPREVRVPIDSALRTLRFDRVSVVRSAVVDAAADGRSFRPPPPTPPESSKAARRAASVWEVLHESPVGHVRRNSMELPRGAHDSSRLASSAPDGEALKLDERRPPLAATPFIPRIDWRQGVQRLMARHESALTRELARADGALKLLGHRLGRLEKVAASAAGRRANSSSSGGGGSIPSQSLDVAPTACAPPTTSEALARVLAAQAETDGAQGPPTLTKSVQAPSLTTLTLRLGEALDEGESSPAPSSAQTYQGCGEDDMERMSHEQRIAFATRLASALALDVEEECTESLLPQVQQALRYHTTGRPLFDTTSLGVLMRSLRALSASCGRGGVLAARLAALAGSAPCLPSS